MANLITDDTVWATRNAVRRIPIEVASHSK